MQMLLILQVVKRMNEWHVEKVKGIMKQTAVADDDPVTWEPDAVMLRSDAAAPVYICIHVLCTPMKRHILHLDKCCYFQIKSQHLGTGQLFSWNKKC